MIVAIRSNKASFKDVYLQPGFNIILADRTKDSDRQDSRNGLGKTTLIEIIHFCLGAQTRRDQGLCIGDLIGWSFSLDLIVGCSELTVTRTTDEPGSIELSGDTSPFVDSDGRQHRHLTVGVRAWNIMLGRAFFGLDEENAPSKYHPSFRSLFSYFVRRGRDAFSSPFDHRGSQREWQKQVSNAFLLGLGWHHASQLQQIKDAQATLNGLRRAATQGLLEGVIGTQGNLEAERVRLHAEVVSKSQHLNSFRVHPNYESIEREATELTSLIQRLTNENILDRRLQDLYRTATHAESSPDTRDVLDVYEAVGRSMPDMVRRRLEDVDLFHRQIIANRRDYLKSERQRIEVRLNSREVELESVIARRAKLLNVLKDHGALREYTRLQELHLDLIARRNDIDSRISNLKQFEQGRSELTVERETLLQVARRDFEERRNAREMAIRCFNANSESLYSAAGNLIIEIADSGFKFDVEIMRSGSEGINSMKIFCYDIMLAQLWSSRKPALGLLVHDSTIFDGVDERQVAQALELAQHEAEDRGFQYLCALNSDSIPHADFSSGFDLDRFVRARFTDASEDGGLLGFRY